MNHNELQQWLIHHLADYLTIPATDIDPTTPLTTYGLDSAYALTLAADLADTFGLLTEPHLAWQHPTINAITQHLTNTTSTQ